MYDESSEWHTVSSSVGTDEREDDLYEMLMEGVHLEPIFCVHRENPGRQKLSDAMKAAHATTSKGYSGKVDFDYHHDDLAETCVICYSGYCKGYGPWAGGLGCAERQCMCPKCRAYTHTNIQKNKRKNERR